MYERLDHNMSGLQHAKMQLKAPIPQHSIEEYSILLTAFTTNPYRLLHFILLLMQLDAEHQPNAEHIN